MSKEWVKMMNGEIQLQTVVDVEGGESASMESVIVCSLKGYFLHSPAAAEDEQKADSKPLSSVQPLSDEDTREDTPFETLEGCRIQVSVYVSFGGDCSV